jgi:hypothetical protein
MQILARPINQTEHANFFFLLRLVFPLPKMPKERRIQYSQAQKIQIGEFAKKNAVGSCKKVQRRKNCRDSLPGLLISRHVK